MGADPAPGQQVLHDLPSPREAGAYVPAEVPRVGGAVEAVQEAGEWEAGLGHEVVLCVGLERLVGAAVGGEDHG